MRPPRIRHFRKKKTNNEHPKKDKKKRSKQNWNRISEHFFIKDFQDKTSSDKQKFKISLGLIGGLELLRSQAKNKVIILKGFQSEDLSNKTQKDYHALGLAADIKIENLSAKETFLLAEKIPEFKGIGLNLNEDYVHVDLRKEAEQQCWIEEKNNIIPFTEELRKKHLANID